MSKPKKNLENQDLWQQIRLFKSQFRPSMGENILNKLFNNELNEGKIEKLHGASIKKLDSKLLKKIIEKGDKILKIYNSLNKEKKLNFEKDVMKLDDGKIDEYVEKALLEVGKIEPSVIIPKLPKGRKPILKKQDLTKAIKAYQEEKDPKKKQAMEEYLISLKTEAEEKKKDTNFEDDEWANYIIDEVNKATVKEAEQEMKEGESSTDMDEMTMATEQSVPPTPFDYEEQRPFSFVSDLAKTLATAQQKANKRFTQEQLRQLDEEMKEEEPKKNVRFEITQQEQPKAMPFQQANDTIGNRNNIGLAPLVDVKAKPENVLVPPDVRKNSINRFANFKWVESIQNSRLGNQSSLYELQEIENERRFGAPLYYLTTPKPLTDREKKYISRSPKYTNKEEIGLIPRNIISTTDSERLPHTTYGWANYNQPDRHIDITQQEINKYPVSKKLGSPWNAEFRMSNVLMNRKEDTPKRNPLIYPSVMYDLKGRKLFN